MSYIISLSIIENLDHELSEIRVRTLKHIEGKIVKGFQQNANVEFNSGKLITKLIGWFNKKPFLEVETVLNLILIILNSEHIHEVIKFLKKSRLEKEINKVYEIFKTSQLYKEIILNIKDIIEKYEEPTKFSESSNSSVPISICSSEDISIQDFKSDNDEFLNEYEEVWSSPSISDVNSLNSLYNSISTISTLEEIKNGLIFFKTAVNDYPAEYFLQPPYIFKNMIKLYFKDRTNTKLLICNLNYLSKALLCRAKKRVFSECYDPTWRENFCDKPKTQITISRFCIEILKICVEHLKEFSESIDQNEIFQAYQLIMVIMDVIKLREYKKNGTAVSLKSILTDLGILAKFYRQEKNFRIYRIQHILIIYIITKLLQQENLNINYTNEIYDKYENTNSEKIETSKIWYSELQYAMLDFSLKNLNPMVYNNVEKIVQIEDIENLELKTVLNCKDIFKSTIEILKNPDGRKDDEFILLASKALDTISIHESLDLVQNVITAISRSMYLFDGNLHLKRTSEQILLQLLASENINIKRIAYKGISNNIKQSFGALMNGDVSVHKFNTQFERPRSLGVPLTAEIISEIICFGFYHQDISIQKNAEIILSLILKGRDVLGVYWKNILEILIPNFPLLQCLVTSENNFGKLILELFNPDNGLESLELIKGNLRFLFSCDDQIRSEAISRLAYILSKNPNHIEFLPNIFEIFDTIPNNLCCIQIPRDPEKIFYGGLYDCTTIPALLELLKSNDVEPNIRKTCLMQLNVLCQDIDLNKIIFNEKGWFYAMQALENSLKKTPTKDYTDSAVPAISVLCKMILCNSFFRKELSNENSFYELLVRVLFLFHGDITLQQDAVITLFLLLYSHIIIGAEKHISVPIILQKLNLPLKCELHLQKSNFTKKTLIEEIFLDLTKDNKSCHNNLGTMLHNTSTVQNHQFSSIPLSRKSEPIYSVARDKRLNDKKAALLQYIRLNFATSWFSNFETICKHIKSINLNDDNATLDYSTFLTSVNENRDEIIEITDVLEFNSNLKMNADDIRLIKITAPAENLKTFFKKLTNATTEDEFLKHLGGVRFCLFLGAHNYLDGNNVLKIFQRFLTIKPNSTGDYNIFENAIEFFDYLIKNENEIIIFWLLNEFNEQHCLILEMLKEYKIPKTTYDSICSLIENLIKYCAKKDHNNKINELILSKNEKSCYNLYNKLFEYLIPITEECFHKRYLDQVRSLLNIVQVVTETKYVDIDVGFANIVIKKLMYFVMALKLFSQSGSHLNKNCLLIIGNLMNIMDEFLLDETHIKLLSGLCSHEDFEIRALSWCILTKVTENLKGAHLIVKELSYLPGGFHACCLSTLLDNNEVPIVRSAAGMLFANLLSHKINTSDGISLHLSVVPLCVELEPSVRDNGLHLIKQIFSKYRFYTSILNSIEHFYIGRTVDCFRIQNITTPEIMSAYCRILSNYISLSLETAAEEFDSEPFMIRIFNLIKIVPSCITNESLGMMSEICFLINKLHTIENIRSIKKNLSSDHGFIVILIQLLNLNYFENKNIDLLVNILHTLKLLVNETISFQLICEIFSSNGATHIIEIILYGLTETKNLDLQNICLTFLISLLVKSDNICSDKFKSIPEIFDSTNLTNNSNPILNGSEQIFNSVKLLFDRIFKIKKKANLLRKTLICEALAILLRTSKKIRNFAHHNKFLSIVIDQINSIFETVTITSTEYIRKYGDSKKDSILQELTILYSIILHWFCSDCLTNELEIEKLSRIALQTWQWINHSEYLREVFLKTLAVLSEDSLQVCKQFSASITSFSNSIMQLTSKMVIAETNKIRHPNIDFNTLELGLGILSNCCNCIEGRLLLVKMNLLDIIGNLHPMDIKIQKSWNIVTIFWLEFWSIFSRYQEGAVLKHLYILCSLIAKTKNKIRILCLKILLNMTFLQNNRPGLLSSQDFQYTVKDILENGNEEEKYTVIIILWKLGAENFRAKHTIKNWGVQSRLKNIQREIDTNDEENNLNSAIQIVLDILK